MCELIVKNIAEEEYAENEKITSVIVQEGCTFIPAGAFMHCRKLKRTHLPSTIREIQDAAFLGCSSLMDIHFPEGMEMIGEYAFSQSGLKNVRIPENVKEIKEMAFYDCEKLESLDILRKDVLIQKDAYCHTPSLKQGYIACGYPDIETKASVFISTLLVFSSYERHAEEIQDKAKELFGQERRLYFQEMIRRDMNNAIDIVGQQKLLQEEILQEGLQDAIRNKKHGIVLTLMKISQDMEEEEFDL